jgi:hypothetical protein
MDSFIRALYVEHFEDLVIGKLRKVYGPQFGKGTGDRERLGDAWYRLDEQSRSQLVGGYQDGALSRMLSTHAGR